MTGRHVRQGGSLLKTEPAVGAFAQKTGTQPYKPPPRSFSSTFSPEAGTVTPIE